MIVTEVVYRLRKVIDGMVHAADVGVVVEVTDRDEVVVASHVFEWRWDVYGPKAVNAPGDPPLIAEATDGVRQALGCVSGRTECYRVEITRIFDTQVDTWPGDIRLAAAGATCAALGVEFDPEAGNSCGDSAPSRL